MILDSELANPLLPDGKAEVFRVPAGACSPAIEVLAGRNIVITELAKDGSEFIGDGCSTIPSDRQKKCDSSTRRSTVYVPVGDISTQTIAIIRNERVGNVSTPATVGGGNSASLSPIGNAFDWPQLIVGQKAAETDLSCTPSHSVDRTMLLCTASVAAAPLAEDLLDGMVKFTSGERILGMVPLKEDNTATMALPLEMLHDHWIVAVYGGNQIFAESTSLVWESFFA